MSSCPSLWSQCGSLSAPRHFLCVSTFTLQCLDLHEKRFKIELGFTSLGKSEGLIMAGAWRGIFSLPQPPQHTHHSLTWSVQEAAGGEREPRRCSFQGEAPAGPSCPRDMWWWPHSLTGLRSVLQIAQAVSGWNPQAPGPALVLSEEILWAANGLPNPFCCSSDHSCLLASFGWKSPPHDGLPGKSVFSSRRAHRIRDCGNIPRLWKLRSKKLNVLPCPGSLLPHG